MTRCAMRFHADLDELGDPRLWSISDADVARVLPELTRLAQRVAALELAAAHQAGTRDRPHAMQNVVLRSHALDHDHEPVRDAMAAGTVSEGQAADRHGRRRAAGREPPEGRDSPHRSGQAARSRIGARAGVSATGGGELPRSVGVTTTNRTRPIASHDDPALPTMCSPWEAQVRLHTVVKPQPRSEAPPGRGGASSR